MFSSTALQRFTTYPFIDSVAVTVATHAGLAELAGLVVNQKAVPLDQEDRRAFRNLQIVW